MPDHPEIPSTHLPPCLEGENHTQLDIMRAGKDYLCMDPYLFRMRERGQGILSKMKDFESDTNKRMEFMKTVCLFENGEEFEGGIMPGFTCEYVSVTLAWISAIWG